MKTLRTSLTSVLVGVLSACAPETGPSLVPAFSDWRTVAVADVILGADIALPTGTDLDGYSVATVDGTALVKGDGLVEGFLFYGPRRGPELVERASPEGVIRNALLLLAWEDSIHYLASDVARSVLPFGDALADSIGREVERQRGVQAVYGQLAATPPSRSVRRLVDDLTESGRAAEPAFSKLTELGCEASPDLAQLIDDRRPVALEGAEVTVRSANAMEDVVHYSPVAVVDAVALALSVITGESFGSIYNGGTERERAKVVDAWRTYVAYFEGGAATCG